MGTLRTVLGLALLAGTVLAAPQNEERPVPPTPPPGADKADPVVARGQGIAVTRSELIPVLLDRYALARDGRDLLKLLVSSRLIDELAHTQGIEASDAEVTARYEEFDRQVKAAGEAEGMAAELRRQGFTITEFRKFLRRLILLEQLTRAALGISEDTVVSADQQEIWLDQEMQNRGLSWPPPPWADGIAARCGSIQITVEEFGETLLDKMNGPDVRETCWHLLLLKGIEKRMPDLAPAARGLAVDQEMARRRARAEAAGETKGISFEEILAARGSNLALLRRDPSVSIAALTRLWVDKVQGQEGVRKEYVDNRDTYEGLYGKAAHVYLIFLVASQYKNELNPRTFEEAEAELTKLKADISTLRGFTATSARYSEEPSIRQNKGDMGWMTRDDARYPQQMRDAVFEFLGAGGEVSAAGRMLGPLRLDTGVALLWLSAVRKSPPWEEMYENVHEELRRRFIEDVMPAKAVEMVVR